MKPYLCVEGGSIDYGVFGDPPSQGRRTHSGYLHGGEDGWLRSTFTYQIGIEKFECASQWDTIPYDTLWRARGSHDIFITYVRKSNLNFRNTPLEHRHNKYLNRTKSDHQLNRLASKEYQMWKGMDKAFIPFKTPNPQGYQGVWMSLDSWLISAGACLRVYDKYSPNHRLETNADWN